jgi:hypothetical protein
MRTNKRDCFDSQARGFRFAYPARDRHPGLLTTDEVLSSLKPGIEASHREMRIIPVGDRSQGNEEVTSYVKLRTSMYTNIILRVLSKTCFLGEK